MNEQTKQLIEFMKTNSFSSRTHPDNPFVFEYAFMIAILSESGKCRMFEDEKGLMLNAARALVEDNREDFYIYLNENNRRIYFQLRQQDYENIVNELVEYIKNNQIFKRNINKWLYDCREEMSNEMHCKVYSANFVAEEHPMQTFVYWLDYLDNFQKSTKIFQSQTAFNKFTACGKCNPLS